MKRYSKLLAIAAVALAVAFVVYLRRPSPVVVAQAGPPIVAVKVPALSAEEQKGEVAYRTYCTRCHGEDGAGQDGVAPPLVHPIYEPNHHGDQAFLLAAMNGARAHHWPFGDMPPVEGVKPADVADIVTYVRALQRANGIY